MVEPRDRIIVALDTKDTREALSLVKSIRGEVGGFKIGLEFITSMLVRMVSGSQAESITELNLASELFALLDGNFFWDGKWHDIPNTIKGATEAIAPLVPKYFNVHASSGFDAIRAAADKKGNSKLLVVTVLTSLVEEEANMIYGSTVTAKVTQFAHNAVAARADGLICSPQEIALIRQRTVFDHLLLVTPGVRPAWASIGDQKRVMTPGEAIKAGATALVIGRPITQPPVEVGTPLDAVRRIIDEIAEAS